MTQPQPNQLDAVYRNSRYLELADQIENHSRAIGYLLAELATSFPQYNAQRYWSVMGDHRPRLLLKASDD
jgi:hypothetical protein